MEVRFTLMDLPMLQRSPQHQPTAKVTGIAIQELCLQSEETQYRWFSRANLCWRSFRRLRLTTPISWSSCGRSESTGISAKVLTLRSEPFLYMLVLRSRLKMYSWNVSKFCLPHAVPINRRNNYID